MNKRDVLTMILEEMREKDGIPLPKMHEATRLSYERCKAVAACNGYSGACFDQLWFRASKMHARELNIREEV